MTLDVNVDLYGGNEVLRRQVRAFIRTLNALARKIDGAVVLSSHVSGAGLQNDGGHSGSTDWSNAVRSRLYLSLSKDDDGADPNARVLTRKKANFASIGDMVRLHWKDGVIVPDEPASSCFGRSAEDVFLVLLDSVMAEGQKVSHKSKGGNFAPSIFMKRPSADREGYQRRDFERAMQALLKSRRIKIAPYGPPSDDTQKIVRNDSPEEPL